MIRTLKRRRHNVFRTVPLRLDLLDRLELVHGIRAKQHDPVLAEKRIWGWSRITAWSKIKRLMGEAGLFGAFALPKGLRHAFGIESTVEANIPLNMVQRWLGHARIETTSIYANAIGAEERTLAGRLWIN